MRILRARVQKLRNSNEANLSDEEENRFHSVFRVVARFFTKKRLIENYIPNDPTELKHVDDMLKLLSVMSGDKRYESLLAQNKEGIKSMCEVADRREKRGEKQLSAF